MKPSFLILLLFIFFSTQLFSYENIHWASEVVGYSSELSETAYSAKQILGEPSVTAHFGISKCAWTPAKNNKNLSEWIKVGFDKAIKVEMICVNQNYNPGAISEIYLFDESGGEHLVFSATDSTREKDNGGKLTLIKIKKTQYKAKYLKIVIPRRWMTDHAQIDAIGISEKYADCDVEINVAPNADFGEPENLGMGVNSIAEELSPIISPDGKTLYFTRDGHPQNIGKNKEQDVWASLYINGAFSDAYNLGAPINNEYSNNIASITPDGNRMMVGNVYLSNGQIAQGVSISKFDGDAWGMPQKVQIDSFYNLNRYAEYSLAPDGKTIMLSIERNDSYGGKDLYVSFIRPDGTFTAPLNIGAEVNTAEDDFAPFISPDNETVFFATKGYPGYGDADIFIIRRLDSTWTKWSHPQNIGPSINTSEWDGYFSVPASGQYAYFVSRKNKLTGSDIYRTRIPQSIKPLPNVLISGKVLDEKTNKPLEAKIIYEELSSGKELGVAYSNKRTGEYKIVLPQGANYGFLAEAKGFIALSENIDLRELKNYQELEKNLYLSRIEKGKSIRLNNIFFDYNSSDLLKESYSELNRIATLMKESPNIKVELTGYTDDVGNDAFNVKLSLDRATAVYNYLIGKSISSSRLTVKGYGKSKPIASNATDAGRRQNRRVEFIILEK